MEYSVEIEQRVSDNEIVEYINQCYSEAVEFKNSKVMSKVQQWRSWFNKEPYGNEADGRSKIVDGIIKNYVYQVVTNLIEPITNNKDMIKLYPNTKDLSSLESIKKTEKLLNYQFNFRVNKFQKFDEIIKLFARDGYVVTKIYWEMDTKKVHTKNFLDNSNKAFYKNIDPITFAKLYDLHIANGDILEKKVVKDDDKIDALFMKEVIVKENPNFIAIPLDNFYWSPDTTKIGYLDYDCDYVIEIEGKTKSELLYLLKNDDTYRKFTKEELEELFNQHTEANNDEKENDDVSLTESLERDRNKNDVVKGNKYVIKNFWGFFDIDDDGYDELIHVELLGEKIIKIEANPFENNMIPYNVAVFEKYPLSMETDSIASLLEDIQKLRTAIVRGMVDSLAYGILKNYIVKSDALSRANKDRLEKREPGQVIMADVRRGESLKDVILPLEINGIPSDYFNFYQVLQEQAQENTGITAYTQGLDSKSLNKTATGVSILTNISMKKIWKITETFVSSVIIQTAKAFLQLNAMFLDRSVFYDLLKDSMDEITKEEININADIVVDLATKGLAQERTNQIIQFLNIALPLTQSGLVSPSIIKEMIIKLARDFNLSEIATKMSELDIQQQGLPGANGMLQSGTDIQSLIGGLIGNNTEGQANAII